MLHESSGRHCPLWFEDVTPEAPSTGTAVRGAPAGGRGGSSCHCPLGEVGVRGCDSSGRGMARVNRRGHVDSNAGLGRAGNTRTETIRMVATLWPPFHLYLRRQSRCPMLIPHRSQQGRSSHHSRSRSDLGSCVRLPGRETRPGMRQQQGKGGEPLISS